MVGHRISTLILQTCKKNVPIEPKLVPSFTCNWANLSALVGQTCPRIRLPTFAGEATRIGTVASGKRSSPISKMVKIDQLDGVSVLAIAMAVCKEFNHNELITALVQPVGWEGGKGRWRTSLIQPWL